MSDLRRAYLTFHLIGEEGKKAVKLISHVDWEEIPVASVSYSGSIDDMAGILAIAISSSGDGGEVRVTTRGCKAGGLLYPLTGNLDTIT